jgi:hypothetical protein
VTEKEKHVKRNVCNEGGVQEKKYNSSYAHPSESKGRKQKIMTELEKKHACDEWPTKIDSSVRSRKNQ